MICGATTRDKETRGRASEETALIGDILTVCGEDAAMMIKSGVGKYADLPTQPLA